MNIEDSIRDQHSQRRLNIMKGIDNLESDYIEKSFDGDLEKAKQYVDNFQNRKQNRVGQAYGKEKEEQPANNQQNSNEENPDPKNSKGNEVQFNPKGDEASNQDENQEMNSGGQHSIEQLQEFAQQADDASLQRFISDAVASGDNSEYMQAQINIAQDELNRRAGSAHSENQMNQEQGQEEGEMNEEENEDGNSEPDFSDAQSVGDYLAANPQMRDRALEILTSDPTQSLTTALKIALAQTTSGNEALQHVEAAKQTLDELHAKLGGGVSNEDENSGEVGASGSISFGQLSDEDRKFFDAPDDAVIAHIGDDSAIYTASEGYLEIVYEDGNYKQFENVSSQEEAMKIVQENVTSEEAITNNEANEENRNQGYEDDFDDSKDLSSHRPDRDDFENDDINLENASNEEMIDWLDYQDENGGPKGEKDQAIYKEAMRRLKAQRGEED